MTVFLIKIIIFCLPFSVEHHLCEVVQLTILENSRSRLSIKLREPFSFMYDSAYHIAIYCLNSVYDVTALENCDHIHTEHFTMADEVFGLDDRLTKAFEYLNIPEGWNLLGLDSTLPGKCHKTVLKGFI